MVHLMVAYQYNPASPSEFWVGNIAPDCIDDRKEKDKLHFRDTLDRNQALRKFERSIGKDDLFMEGMLLHLFVDWKWDEDLLQQYILNSNSDDWFNQYRNEIGILSARLYHDNLWSADVWKDILNCDIPKFNTTEISSEGVLTILQQVNRYHIKNPLAKPLFYSLELINKFTAKTAEDYKNWKNAILLPAN